MTLLHVICGLGPPIKNPGYAYASSLAAVKAQPEERLANRTQKMLGVLGVAKIFD